MKLIFRNFISTLKRYSASSLLNIAGLSIAFASLYLIIAQLKYDYTYNQAIPDHENLYMATITPNEKQPLHTPWVSRYLLEEVSKSVPQIEKTGLAVGPLYEYNITHLYNNNPLTHTMSVGTTSKNAIELLGLEIIDGSIENFDLTGSLNTAIISESKARQYNISAGDVIYFGDKIAPEIPTGRVVAIYKDRPDNVDFCQTDITANVGADRYQHSAIASQHVFIVKAAKGVTQDDLNTTAQKTLMQQAKVITSSTTTFKDLPVPEDISITFIPITQTYLNPLIVDSEKKFGQGNVVLTYILISIAILILVVAFVNFINFFFALVPVRIKSVNTYKIFGCSNLQLRINFITETIGLAIVSLAVATVLIAMVDESPLANYITSSIRFEDNIPTIIVTAVVALVLAVLTSILPARYITSFSPLFTIKGAFAGTRQGKALRYTLVTVQLVISLALICCTTFIQVQYNHTMDRDLGYSKDNLFSVELPPEVTIYQPEKANIFLGELKKSPIVENTILSRDYLLDKPSFTNYMKTIDSSYIAVNYVDIDYIKLLGLKILDGRDFIGTDTVTTQQQ